MKHWKRYLAMLLVVVGIMGSMTGCAGIGAFFSTLKGELFGNGYTITQYDNYGNLVFPVYGDRVTMDCELDENGEVSSYIDITIDGKTYTVKTLLNGISKVNIKYAPGKYVMEAYNPVTGQKAYNTIFIFKKLMENKDVAYILLFFFLSVNPSFLKKASPSICV